MKVLSHKAKLHKKKWLKLSVVAAALLLIPRRSSEFADEQKDRDANSPSDSDNASNIK